MTETVEIIKDRLFWCCLRTLPQDNADAHYFSTDEALIYDPYYSDFGPLNIAQICRYCRILNQKLADPSKQRKRIVHCCRPQNDTRANSVLLVCCWSFLYNNATPTVCKKSAPAEPPQRGRGARARLGRDRCT